MGHSDERRFFIEDRLTVAELGSDIDFRGDTGVFLQHVFPGKTCVGGGTAGDEHHPPYVFQSLGDGFKTAEFRLPFARKYSPAQRALDRLRFFKDLFEHEMRMSPFLCFLHIPRNVIRFPVDILECMSDHLVPAWREHRAFAVFKIEDFAGMGQKRRWVGGKEQFSISNADNKRTAEPGSHDGAGFFLRGHRDRIRAVHMGKCGAYRIEKRHAVPMLALYQVREHF